MKKHISKILILTLVLTSLLTGFAGTALADASVSISIEPSSVETTVGQTVSLTAAITNGSPEALADYKVVCGSQEFTGGGALAIGDTGTISVNLNITSDMVGKDIALKVQYTTATIPAMTDGGQDTVKINEKVKTIKLGVTPNVSKNMAGSGETVTFSFKVENQGEAQLDNIVVKAPELNGGKALNTGFSLAAGSDSFTVTYKHKMSADVIVNPTVSYSSGGAAQTPITLAPMELKLEERNVSVELNVDNKNPQPGEEVTFTLKVSNGGNVSYTDLSVTMNGEKVDFPENKLKPGDAFEETYKRAFNINTDVSFQVTLKDHNGETKSVPSNTISIALPVDSAAVNEKLQLVLNVDRPQLTSAGSVTFSGYISNATEYELLNVAVNEASIGNIYTSASLAAGGKASIEWPVDINATTSYSFVLTATDKDGNSYEIAIDPITVTVQSVEATPTNFDDAAEVTVSGQVLDASSGDFDWSKFFLILAIVLVVLIIGVGVALLVLWKKGKMPGGSGKTAGRTAARPATRPAPSSSSARKKPTGNYNRGPRKPSGPKNYRDRNNF